MTPELWKRYLQPMADEVMASYVGAPVIALMLHDIVKQIGALGKTLCVGCGDGTELKFFKGVGVTLNTKGLREGYQYICADMHTLPFKDKSFDGVFCKDCFEHALAPSIVLQEFVRVARCWMFLAIPSEEWSLSELHPLILTAQQIVTLGAKEGWDTYHEVLDISQPEPGKPSVTAWKMNCYLLRPSALTKEQVKEKLCPKSR
jgi:hypothetical protein